jgi:hypothetical protein
MASDDVHALAARVEATVGEGFDPKVSVRRAQPYANLGIRSEPSAHSILKDWPQ